MPNVIIQIDLLLPVIQHATRPKSIKLPVAICATLRAQQQAIDMEMHYFSTVVAALILTGLLRTAQKFACIVSQLNSGSLTALNLIFSCVVVAQSSFSNTLPCSSGVFTQDFCCSDVARSPEAPKSCCSRSLQINPGNPYVFQDDASTSSPSATSSNNKSSSTSTSSSTQISSRIAVSTNAAISSTLASSSTPSDHTNFKNATAIRVGLGVPLSLLLLLNLGFLLRRERQRKTMMESLKGESQTVLSKMWQKQPHDEYPLVSNKVLLSSKIRAALPGN